MQQKVATPPAPEPVEKFPIPEEHIYLQVVLDELRNKCAQHANNPVLEIYIDIIILVFYN